ncbi:MAG: hypothetical protein M1814_005539 [Vezdaea aestivalis]|nr:MAG: hypothetical protein M1814_005539 [Vezdaea aestivalis]
MLDCGHPVDQARVTFRAPTQLAVAAFHAAAVTAGGISLLTSQVPSSTSVIQDPDGNILTAVHNTSPQTMASTAPSSRVLSWQSDVAASVSPQSDVSLTPSYKIQRQSTLPSQLRQQQQPLQFQPQYQPLNQNPVEAATAPSKAVWGTLLGAAAGATVAYAMTRAETQDTFARVQNPPQNCYQSFPVQRAQTLTYKAEPSFSDSVRTISGVANGLNHVVKAIESPPSQLASGITNLISSIRISDSPPTQPSYREPTRVTYEIDEVDGASKAPSHRSRRSVNTANSESTLYAPRMLPLPASASTIYDERSHTSSRRSSKRSSKSGGKSNTSTIVPSRRGSQNTLSLLPEGRRVQYEVEEIDSVVPEDSISQVSSKHSRHSRRSHRSDGERSHRSSRRGL